MRLHLQRHTGICQHIALMCVPLWAGLKNAYLAMVHAPAPPANMPPAPPPPPASPDIITVVSLATFNFAKYHPTWYLLIDLFFLIFFGTLFLFLKDITDFIERKKMEAAQAAQGKAQKSHYAELQAEAAKEAETEALQREDQGDTEFDSEEVKSAAELKAELRLTKDKVEELLIKTRVYRKSTTDKANAMREQLKTLQERQDELETIVNGAEKKGMRQRQRIRTQKKRRRVLRRRRWQRSIRRFKQLPLPKQALGCSRKF